MRRIIHTLICSTILLPLLFSTAAQAEAKRIVVSANTGPYYDVSRGDTLSQIAAKLLPQQPRLQPQFMRDVVALNPQAFVNNDPNRLKANVRLWLPGHIHSLGGKKDADTIEQFRWGYIRRSGHQQD